MWYILVIINTHILHRRHVYYTDLNKEVQTIYAPLLDKIIIRERTISGNVYFHA